jgi:hypothetical protein
MGQQYQAGHARFDYDRIRTVQPQDDAFTQPLHGHDCLPQDPPTEDIDARPDGDGFRWTRNACDGGDAAADDCCGAAAHGLDLRKLRHISPHRSYFERQSDMGQ